MQHKTVLISIHPHYAQKILSGEKRVEFRRAWARQSIDRLLIYSTSPKCQLVALARVKNVTSGSPTALWAIAQKNGGGITRENLLIYLKGKKSAFAVEIKDVIPLGDGLPPSSIFGRKFRAPQSFRYLKETEEKELKKLIDT